MTINKKVFDKLKGRRIYQFYLDEETGKITDITDSMDYVKVIRCKDCMYMTEHYDTDGNAPYYTCSTWEAYTDDDGFCHYAEKEEE